MRAQAEIRARITIENPVPGVLHSLQASDGAPLDPKASTGGEPVSFDFPLRVGAGPKFYGDQVRPEGPQRRFVYICAGAMAGQDGSPWSRRMKIDIHDTDPALLDVIVRDGSVLELVVEGTATDGSPACARVRPLRKRAVPA